MAKAPQQTNPQPQPQQPQSLDYRQYYAQQHGAPANMPMPYGQQQMAPAYNPYPAYPGYGRGMFRNPLTGGQWLMIVGGAVMIGGLAYYGWVRWKQSKATTAPQTAATNPAHVVRHLRPQASYYGYGRAA